MLEDGTEPLQGRLIVERHKVGVTEAVVAVQQQFDALVHHPEQRADIDQTHAALRRPFRRIEPPLEIALFSAQMNTPIHRAIISSDFLIPR